MSKETSRDHRQGQVSQFSSVREVVTAESCRSFFVFDPWADPPVVTTEVVRAKSGPPYRVDDTTTVKVADSLWLVLVRHTIIERNATVETAATKHGPLGTFSARALSYAYMGGDTVTEVVGGRKEVLPGTRAVPPNAFFDLCPAGVRVFATGVPNGS